MQASDLTDEVHTAFMTFFGDVDGALAGDDRQRKVVVERAEVCRRVSQQV